MTCTRCGGWMIDRLRQTESYCIQCGHRVYSPMPERRPISLASHPACLKPARKGVSFADSAKANKQAYHREYYQRRKRAGETG